MKTNLTQEVIIFLVVFLSFQAFFHFSNRESIESKIIQSGAKLDSLRRVFEVEKQVGDSLRVQIQVRDKKIKLLVNEIEKIKWSRDEVDNVVLGMDDSIVVSDVRRWASGHVFERGAISRDLDVAR